MVGGEVDVALDVGGVGGVVSVGSELGVVGYAGLCEAVVGVGPRLDFAGEHLPPYSDELHGLDPGGVVDFTGLVEVEDELGGEDVASVVADDEGAPGCVEGQLEISCDAEAVGDEVGTHGVCGGVDVEEHCGVSVEGSLVDVDVDGVGGFEEERRLDCCTACALGLAVAAV